VGLEFLRRTRVETLVIGALAGAVVALLGHRAVGAGILVGAAWGAANLWGLARLLRMLTRREGEASRRMLLLWSAVKFPLLYGAGYAILRWGRMPVESLLGGFSLLFMVWGVEAAVRSLRTPGSTAGNEERSGEGVPESEGGNAIC
jgi:hypothetical protein